MREMSVSCEGVALKERESMVVMLHHGPEHRFVELNSMA